MGYEKASYPVNSTGKRWIDLLCAIALGASVLAQAACESDDDSNDDDDIGDDDVVVDAGQPGCDDIEFSPIDYYLAKGSIAAHWYQTGWVDTNGNNALDPEEQVDGIIDLMDMCESGKESIVVLMATDD